MPESLAGALIPRPSELRIERYSEQILKEWMGVDDATFRGFRDKVFKLALETLPPEVAGDQLHNCDQWNIFLERVHIELPNLNRYEEDWHLVVFCYILRDDKETWDQWVEFHRESAITNSNYTVPKRAVPTTTTSKKRKCRRKYFGKVLPRKMRIVDWKDVPVQEILRGTDSHSTSACPIDLPPPKGLDTTVTPHLESVIKVGMEQLYPAPCTACGFLPNVSATETSEISNFFLSAKDLLPYLRRVGIIHDRHLRAILNWEEANRLEFIDALPSKLVPMMEKIRLRRLLVPRAQAPNQNNQYQNHRYEGSPATPRREREYEYAQIPRPSKEEEERLSSPRTPLDELRKAMTIQPENFESVTAAIDAVYEQYSDKLNDAGVTAWKEFYNALYAREPVLQLYRTTSSNNWAASIYIKHLLRPSHKTAAGPTSQTQTRENSRTSTMPCTPPRRPELVPSKLQRQMAGFGKGATTVLDIPTPGLLEQSASMPNPHRGITLTTCPIHYPPDPRIVSPNLQELLGSSGSDELLPAFVAVGIRTDEGVKELASLSKKDRVQLFKENQDLKFTELQTFMLKTMLHKL